MASLLSADTTVKRVRYLMGCFVEIQAAAQTEKAAAGAVEAAFREMKRIENLLSRFKPESVISQINRRASTRPLRIPDEVFSLLRLAKKYSELSDGFFDITTLPLTELWNKAENRNEIPSPEEIRQTLFSVGHVWIKLDEREKTVFFDRPGMGVDLGAMGKGYAVDRAMAVLRFHSIEEALLSTGSTIYYAGHKPAVFGTQDPENENRILTTFSLQNQAVSTSAQSERFWPIRGKRYGHILNPKTGFPATFDLLSASIVADSAMQSDILATASFVSGQKMSVSPTNCLTRF